TPPQRAECLRSFEKLAGMEPEDRQEFLKSAKLWEQMTGTERQAWKDLLTKLSRLPPVPPGLGFPPVPRAVARSMTHAGSTPAGTNQLNCPSGLIGASSLARASGCFSVRPVYRHLVWSDGGCGVSGRALDGQSPRVARWHFQRKGARPGAMADHRHDSRR